ncbi:TPA: AbrB/MazE/SpoVT family DNA-binding domain-containing protein [Candidatus Woesearchaeota archaeon]|nr:AbrB/MazE/SpoVT family DNA-binding domain-containing protein [Candidatus Woesearchaeota archaeon]
MPIEVDVKRWGNSYAVILPKEFVKAKEIKTNDRIVMDAYKPVSVKSVFGLLKGKRKLTGQQAKDLARKGWS